MRTIFFFLVLVFMSNVAYSATPYCVQYLDGKKNSSFQPHPYFKESYVGACEFEDGLGLDYIVKDLSQKSDLKCIIDVPGKPDMHIVFEDTEQLSKELLKLNSSYDARCAGKGLRLVSIFQKRK